jgi:DNA polymerase-1
MLVNCDVKGLEVVVAAELSGDETLRREVRDKLDFHQLNQDRFGLPSRVVAKRFKFKLLYGATAFGYAHDSDFVDVSTSEKYWQGIIDEYYAKYKGIRKWHNELINTAKRHGQLEIPSGRFYPIIPDPGKREPWPLTVIKNYPVQGFGADLVMLARLQARKELYRSGLISRALLIATIHDSIVVDCENGCVEEVGRILNQSVEDVPRLCRQVFGYAFSLPLTAEVQYGPNKKEMKELTFA